ncbi:biotin/lipoyl-containing protein [Candidatus Phytoplasma oryzae]|nr:hypothetical protein PIE28_00905 [Candidatus Phytoplasma oryzae]
MSEINKKKDGRIEQIFLTDAGEGLDQATIIQIHVQEGDKIVKKQPLLEVEYEKLPVTIESIVDGVIKKIHCKTGEVYKIGDLLLTIEKDEK